MPLAANRPAAIRDQGLDILIPTCDRGSALVFTLSGVAGQSALPGARVIVADQSSVPVTEDPVVRSLFRIIEARGAQTAYFYRPHRLGIAEQRQFLLDQSSASRILYLDDDVYLEPWVIERLGSVLEDQGCGFVGAFPSGLSFSEDVRPAQQRIEFWKGPVQPEVVEPGSREWDRNLLHRAANLWHVAGRLGGEHRLYKVAWVASCVLYDRAKLTEVGGFGFWRRLPRYHSGEDVLVQNLLMRRYGGCAILPSGAYHAEVPSSVLNGRGTVDGHALDLLAEATATEPMVLEESAVG